MVPNPAEASNKKLAKFFTKEEVAEHNTKDDLWVIIQGDVYDCTTWKSRHPGGEIVLQGIAGQDGSTPFVSFHDQTKARPLMNAFRIGHILNYEQTPMAADFESLRKKLYELKFYETDYTYYYWKLAWFVFLFAVTWTLITSGETWKILVGGVSLGFFWQQVAFVGHDVGHNSVTHIREKDWWYGIYVTLFFGVSGQWWKRSHNTHHIFPNSIDWDPDIQHLPFLSMDSRILQGIYSYYHKKKMPFDIFAKYFIRWQHLTFFPIMGVARFFMYVQSWVLMLDTSVLVYYRFYEICALAGYWVWMCYMLSFVPTWGLLFAVIFFSHGFCGLLHIQITLSHFAMPAYLGTGYVENDLDHYIRVQLSTTTDIGCSPWMDWFHGGLQFQTAHHLFPRVPRHNLRRLRHEHLLPFFEKHKDKGIEYRISTGFLPTMWFVVLKMYEQAMLVRAGKHIALSDSLLVNFFGESLNG